MVKIKIAECRCCKREIRIHNRGLCSACYRKLKESGMLNELYPPLKNNPNSIKEFTKCKAEGCDSYSFENGYCRKHNAQIKNHGHILEKTKYDPNEIIINKELNCAEILLYNKKLEEVARAIIDIEDVDRVKDYRWSLSHEYVISPKIGGLHRFIMNVHEEECTLDNLVDHINRNPLDNRKKNLRVVTNRDNGGNQSLASNNTSGIIGVSWHKRKNKWQVGITVDGKVYYLGAFEDFNDAVICRLKAELKYWGKEFASQRHLFKEYEII